MSKPSRMTLEFEALFRQQAEVNMRKKSLKALARLTGFAPSYCWMQIQTQMERMRETEKVSVSRETNPDTLRGCPSPERVRNAEPDTGQLQAPHHV